jgi:hypothetical protein
MPSQQQAESDNSYTGFASRLDPANLPQGILQAAQNVRLQRGIAQPRKGCQRLTDTDLNPLTMVGSGVWIDSLGRDNIVLVFSGSMYLYRPAQIGYSEDTIGPFLYPTGRLVSADIIVDPIQALDKIIIFRGQYDDTSYAATISNASIPDGDTGIITVTTSVPHGYATNNEVTVRQDIYNATKSVIDGNYVITVLTPTTFTFEWQNTTGSLFTANTNYGPATVTRGKPPLIWDSTTTQFILADQKYINPAPGVTALTGITNSLPPAEFGFYYQNRIVCKYSNHNLVVSDILSFNVDVFFNKFTINQGGNDVIVGCLPWIENQFLVFMRSSIYIAFLDPVTGISATNNSQITVITTELGCLARKTIVNAGQYVMFLSTKGIYLLTPQLDLKVIGNTMPLSEPISDFFTGVDYSIVGNSVAAYYDNRFFVALPIDDPANPTARNNRIIIYNNLNKNWESIDIYPAGLNADNLVVASYQFQKRLFILTNFAGALQFGGVFLTEEIEGGDFYTNAAAGVALPFSMPADLNAGSQLIQIPAFVRTREFTMDSLSEKRFSRGEFQFNNVQQDTVAIFATMHDPDSTQEILGYQFSGNSDGTLRPRIAMRGSSADFTIQFSSGRPALKGVTIYGIGANRPMVSQE